MCGCERVLVGCALSIHLVGESYGAVPDGPSQKSLVVLQDELAVQRSKSGVLRCSGAGSAKRAMRAEEAGAPEREKPPERPTVAAGTKLIYFICDEEDRKATVPVRKLCRQLGFEVALPAFEGDASQVRKTNQQLWPGATPSSCFTAPATRHGNAPSTTN